MYREAVGAHGSKTLRELLLHGIDGRIDTHKGHDPECDNGYGDTGSESIAPDRTERKGKNVAYSHE
jgi:hypothetical protein